jgi:hypothetical protein
MVAVGLAAILLVFGAGAFGFDLETFFCAFGFRMLP